jgi:hypothetical protein
MDFNDFLDNLETTGGSISIDILQLLKLPIILVLIGNIFFSLLLFLRVRILADTFKAPQNKIVKTIILLYIFLVLVGSLLSLLFVILT